MNQEQEQKTNKLAYLKDAVANSENPECLDTVKKIWLFFAVLKEWRHHRGMKDIFLSEVDGILEYLCLDGK